ncbi:MAG: helicase C-terminal domain-containing protein [Chloroflexota bacterium]
MLTTYIAFDLEATGGADDDDEIMEIGAIKFQGDQIVARFQTLVRPRRPPTLRVQHLTGIGQAELQTAPPFSEVQAPLQTFLEDVPLVAHSVELDRDRLRRQGLPITNLGLDTYELAGILVPGLPSYSLLGVAEALELPVAGQHRALPDAELTRQVFRTLFERLVLLDPRLLLQVNELLANSAWPLRLLLREAERLAAAGALSRPIAGRQFSVDPEGLPFIQRGSDAPPLEATGAPKPLDLAALHAVWGADGPLARGFPDYELRPQQEEMSAAVGSTFNDGERLLVEAGTGTGKTLAYLVPAAQWALQNGERVVISTNTVNLQDQIYSKDVPDLQRALGKRFLVHLLKGRSNYLCLLRWADFRNRHPGGAPLSPLESRVLVKVLFWLGRTSSGDQVELNLVGEEQALWSQISATQETCTNDACRFKQRRTCYFFNARRAAEAAHLIVVNHALLLSDLAAENGVLPEYEHLIVDEAHHLEEQATRHLGFDLQRRDFFALLLELNGSGDPQRPGGLTQELSRVLPRSDAAGVRALERLRRAEECVERAREVGARFFGGVAAFLGALTSEGGNRTPFADRTTAGFERHTRVTAALREHRRWPELGAVWSDLSVVLAELQQHLEHTAQDIAALPGGPREDWERSTVLLTALTRHVLHMRIELDALIDEPDDNRVYWISQGDHQEALSLHSAPLNVGELLEPMLFAPRRTVVLTSATLTVNNRFEFLRGRLGLTSDTATVQIGSPFDYPRQALIFLPEDLADPMAPAYVPQVNEALIEFVAAARGRCLVLFTAHAALRATYRAIKGPLEQQGIAVVAQGVDGSRNQLIQTLRGHHATVVLGSASFWEGVDVAGEALSALAIVRLPFAVPSDPVFAARCEQFTRPFDEYSVPQAVLRFKQGFGRLIRTANDRGVLLVMDRRVTSKYYGQQFLRSLPSCTVQRSRLRDLGEKTAAWLGGR